MPPKGPMEEEHTSNKIQRPEQALNPPHIPGAGQVAEPHAATRPRNPFRTATGLNLYRFRWAIAITVLSGIGAIYVVAVSAEATPPKAYGTTQLHDFDTVQIAGKVTGDPEIFSENGKVSGLVIRVDDRDTLFDVQAHRSLAETIVAQNLLPRRGDRVTAKGMLRTREGSNPAIILQKPDDMHVTSKGPQLPLDRAEHTRATTLPSSTTTKPRETKHTATRLKGEAVEITGEVVFVRHLKHGGTVFTVRSDRGKTRQVYASPKVAPNTAKGLTKGTRVTVRGVNDHYKGKPQVRAKDVKVLANTTQNIIVASKTHKATALNIKDIKHSSVGSIISTKGTIVSIKKIHKGSIYKLTDNNHSILMVLWDDIADKMAEKNKLSSGTTIRIKGKVKNYKGKLELIPLHPEDITIIK